MKQLACEMCGGTDLVKQDGVFVCQSCGCKYSVEEARKMMMDGEATEEAGLPKTPAPPSSLTNYLEIARTAISAGNNKEAEDYCNKIIERDVKNWEAWYLKGKAAGWQSTLANNRVPEAVAAFKKAIECFPADDAEAVKEFATRAGDEVARMHNGLLALRMNIFKANPDDSSFRALEQDFQNAVLCELSMVLTSKLTVSLGSPERGKVILAGAREAWSNAQKKYQGDGHPNDHQFSTFVAECQNIIKGYQKAISAFGTDYKDAQTADLIISAHQDTISVIDAVSSAKSYKVDYSYGSASYQLSRSMSASTIDSNKKMIASIRGEIRKVEAKRAELLVEQEKLERAKKKQEREAYWQAHPEEKAELEARLRTLRDQRETLKDACDRLRSRINELRNGSGQAVPASAERKQLEQQIKQLQMRRDSLGLFKGKEKKALQAQIDDLSSGFSAIDKRIEAQKEDRKQQIAADVAAVQDELAPHQEKLAAINKEIEAVNAELNGDR